MNTKITTNKFGNGVRIIVRIKHKFLIFVILFSIWYLFSSLFNLLYTTRTENIEYFDTVRAEISVQYQVPYQDLRMVVKKTRPSSEGQYIVRVKGEDSLCLDDNEEIVAKIEDGIEQHELRESRASARLGRSFIFFAVISGIAYFRIWLFGVIRDIKKRLRRLKNK